MSGEDVRLALSVKKCRIMLNAFLLLAIAATPQSQSWTVDGVTREALVQSPTVKTERPPVVFVFHGHGGQARNMARKDFAKQWPEAFFVFPQGLLTRSYYDPDGKRTGWQNNVSNDGDRDLKFFDVMLQSMLARGIDPNRVYASGHSNGGYFSYLLWAKRREQLAAIASSAGGGPEVAKLQPLPAMHLAGRVDSVVPFDLQSRTMDSIRRVNRCGETTQPLDGIGIEYESKLNIPVVTFVHDGGHEFIDDAPQRIVAFFKRHTRPEDGYPQVDPLQEAGNSDRFSQFDTNGDGKIDTDELQRPFLFRVLDKDADGVITRAEAGHALGKL